VAICCYTPDPGSHRLISKCECSLSHTTLHFNEVCQLNIIMYSVNLFIKCVMFFCYCHWIKDVFSSTVLSMKNFFYSCPPSSGVSRCVMHNW